MAERVVARHLAQAGVSGEQLALLSLIATEEPITPTALAAEMGVPLTTLADALRRLDGRDELERLPNPADQRSHLLTLSAEGRARLEAAEPALRKAAAELRTRAASAGTRGRERARGPPPSAARDEYVK
jgi:DNA-binding MarR family transcriptional regulator